MMCFFDIQLLSDGLLSHQNKAHLSLSKQCEMLSDVDIGQADLLFCINLQGRHYPFSFTFAEVIIWNRFKDRIADPGVILAVGEIVLVEPERIRVEINEDGPTKGSTLVIPLAERKDEGKYVCQATEGNTLKHWVTIRGNFVASHRRSIDRNNSRELLYNFRSTEYHQNTFQRSLQSPQR